MADVCTIYVNEIKILFIQLDFMKRTFETSRYLQISVVSVKEENLLGSECRDLF